MNRQATGRIISVLVGAVVLFGLQQGLDMKLTIAIPLAITVYLAVKVAFGLLWSDKAT